MKHVKKFENSTIFEYLIVEVEYNKYNHLNISIGNVYLLQTLIVDDDGSGVRVRMLRSVSENGSILPVTSFTFKIHDYNTDNIFKRYKTGYNYIYKVLYSTNDHNDANLHYNMIIDSKKYNL